MRGVAASLTMLMAMPVEAAAPVIYRGSGAVTVSAVPAAAPASPVAVAGRRLWLVDRDGGELIGCAVERTTTLGRRRIRCTRGSLP